MTNPANWGGEQRLTTSSFDLEQAPNIEGQTLSGYFLGDDQGLAAQGDRFLSLFTVAGTNGPGTASIDFTGPTHRRVPQPGRARNRQGASQAGSCQTANDGSDKSGMGVPRSIETRNKTHACMALRWNETKKNTVLRIRMRRDQGRGRCLVALA